MPPAEAGRDHRPSGRGGDGRTHSEYACGHPLYENIPVTPHHPKGLVKTWPSARSARALYVIRSIVWLRKCTLPSHSRMLIPPGWLLLREDRAIVLTMGMLAFVGSWRTSPTRSGSHQK